MARKLLVRWKYSQLFADFTTIVGQGGRIINSRVGNAFDADKMIKIKFLAF